MAKYKIIYVTRTTDHYEKIVEAESRRAAIDMIEDADPVGDGWDLLDGRGDFDQWVDNVLELEEDSDEGHTITEYEDVSVVIDHTTKTVRSIDD